MALTGYGNNSSFVKTGKILQRDIILLLWLTQFCL